MRSTPALLCLVLAFGAAAATAQKPQPKSQEARKQALEQLDAQLHRGEWAAAEAELRARLAEALQQKGDVGIADAVARLALSESGAGHVEEALWHWTMARSLGSRFDPRPFGPPGERLAESPARHWDEMPAGLDLRRPEDGKGPLEPAHRTAGKNPEVPNVWRAYPKAIRVQAIVDAQGRLAQPVVEGSSYPALTYAVLEAMRSWTIEPAKTDGKPVASFYEVKIPGPQKALAEMVDWKDSPLAAPEALLRAGKFAEADKKLQKVWSSALNGAEQSRGFLGVALSLRALAAAGLGEEDGAICRWQAAQTLEPLLFNANLAAYGAPGALLGQHPWGEGAQQVETVTALRESPEPGEVRRPEILKRSAPQFPGYARQVGFKQAVEVESIITESGTLRTPTLRTPNTSSGLEASALDTLCDWRFKPATFRGQPVKVYYSLTVNFEVRP